MTKTPIFDQLAAEFAARGKEYDNLVAPIMTAPPAPSSWFSRPVQPIVSVIPLHTRADVA